MRVKKPASLKPLNHKPFLDYYLKCAEQCANNGDVDNTINFLELSEDFISCYTNLFENIKRSANHKRILDIAYQKGIEFSINRAEDMLRNKEKERMVRIDCRDEITLELPEEDHEKVRTLLERGELRAKCMNKLLKDANNYLNESNYSAADVSVFRKRIEELGKKVKSYRLS
ncbi:hypothetical protein JW851_03670 [Candidatus Woesearchaeota archaeon]|nr:hypothetical protein [Candidatus Woesearchaeota archaeon]